jgi:hypothetical protein
VDDRLGCGSGREPMVTMIIRDAPCADRVMGHERQP